MARISYALSRGLPILYFMPVRYVFEQARLHVRLCALARMGELQTTQGFSFRLASP